MYIYIYEKLVLTLGLKFVGKFLFSIQFSYVRNIALDYIIKVYLKKGNIIGEILFHNLFFFFCETKLTKVYDYKI